MAAKLQVLLRSPDSYDLAGKAIEEMKQRKVWPTPINFEIWLEVVANPDGVLGREIKRIVTLGEAITEAKSEELASAYLPKHKIESGVREAETQLSKHLDGVSLAIKEAQQSSADYGRTLAGATQDMELGGGSPALKTLIKTLTDATKRVQTENAALEQRLNDSTREVEQLQQNLNVVRRDAMTDGLTNLANRKSFDDGIEKAAAHAEATGQSLTLAVLDIDHFKRFNDTWGHQTGDQVIRYVASVIDRLGAEPRMAARYGGEEFAIILPGDPADMAVKMLDAMRLEIASRALKRRSTKEDLGAVTVSVGIAGFRKGETAAALVGRADQALYASKRSGRNRVTNAEDRVNAAA